MTGLIFYALASVSAFGFGVYWGAVDLACRDQTLLSESGTSR